MSITEQSQRMVKDFCRLVVDHEISDDDAIEFFDVVQSVSPAKLMQAVSEDGEMIDVQVLVYEVNDQHIYEIVLEDQLSMDESQSIAHTLVDEFDFDFEFETSLEVSE